MTNIKNKYSLMLLLIQIDLSISFFLVIKRILTHFFPTSKSLYRLPKYSNVEKLVTDMKNVSVNNSNRSIKIV